MIPETTLGFAVTLKVGDNAAETDVGDVDPELEWDDLE